MSGGGTKKEGGGGGGTLGVRNRVYDNAYNTGGTIGAFDNSGRTMTVAGTNDLMMVSRWMGGALRLTRWQSARGIGQSGGGGGGSVYGQTGPVYAGGAPVYANGGSGTTHACRKLASALFLRC